MPGERPFLLMVEDDLGLQRQMKWSFDQYSVVFAQDRESAIAQLRRHEPCVVTLDLGLPPKPSSAEEGLRTLEAILRLAPAVKVIALAHQGDRDSAVRAIGIGAHDVLEKPFAADVLGLVIARAFHVAELEHAHLREHDRGLRERFGGLITRDPTLLALLDQLGRTAASDVNLLLRGETGTGKTTLAIAVHAASARAHRPQIVVDCAASSETDFGLELSGINGGAGAVTRAAREGGSLLLENIDELPIRAQAMLLSALDATRVGSDFRCMRVISTATRDLRRQIAAGTFREDLYFRLGAVSMTLPPLRERIGDAPLLAHAFLQRAGRQRGRERLVLRSEALEALRAHRWPGNVRELEHRLARAMLSADAGGIGAHELGLAAVDEPCVLNLRQIRDEAERAAVLEVMARVDGNIARAAELLGISRPTLYDLLNRFGLR